MKIGGAFAFGAPSQEEIVKSLKECMLYLIDQRVWENPSKAVFVPFPDNGEEPKLVAAGKLLHVWKDEKKEFTIQITEVSASLNSTNNGASPPFRKVCMHVEMNTMGKTA